MYFGTALANDDATGVNNLAAVNFNAKSFRLGITAIARSAAAFFMCHLMLLIFLKG